MRLKADFDYVFLFLPSRFNSKLVRLKGLRFDKPFLVSTGFQFQTGAIKSRTVIDDSYPRFFGFNSKLVRLKGMCGVWSADVLVFQFQTGAIKSCDLTNPSRFPRPRFNSKLVRLKGGTEAASQFSNRHCFNSKLVRLKAFSRHEALSC